jgi:hypothetical protein
VEVEDGEEVEGEDAEVEEEESGISGGEME